jgi:hypothetical protein
MWIQTGSSGEQTEFRWYTTNRCLHKRGHTLFERLHRNFKLRWHLRATGGTITGIARHTQPTPMYCSLLRVPASRAPTVVKSGCFGSARSIQTCCPAACSAATPLSPYCTVATASVTCGFTLPAGGYTGDGQQ